MQLAVWLIALAGPIIRRILISLGIGLVTYVGVEAAVSGAIASAASAANSMPVQVFQVFGLAGGFQALSILAGGLTARVAIMTLKKFKPA